MGTNLSKRGTFDSVKSYKIVSPKRRKRKFWNKVQMRLLLGVVGPDTEATKQPKTSDIRGSLINKRSVWLTIVLR